MIVTEVDLISRRVLPVGEKANRIALWTNQNGGPPGTGACLAKHSTTLLFGEFTDKSVEDEYLSESLGDSTRLTAYIALVFGFILGLFVVHSYVTEGSTPLFSRITPIRLIFILVSIAVFVISRRITRHKHLVLVISLYQALMIVIYLLTLKQYDSLTYFSILGFMVITLAMYPNKLVFSQIVSVAFSILFFADPVWKLVGLQSSELFRVGAYQTILLFYCSLYYRWSETTKRKAFIANRELLDLSCKDPLTGLYNRKRFDDALDEWMSLSKRYGHPLSLILFDIDNFKRVNDTYGHMAGDSLLKDIAVTVNNAVRETDTFARWGGDEFAILLPNTDLQRAEKMTERLRERIQNSTFGTLKGITCSFGVAEYEKSDTKQSLLNRADDLLLQAKSSGKGRVVVR